MTKLWPGIWLIEYFITTAKIWAASSNQRPVFRSRDHYWPIRGQKLTHWSWGMRTEVEEARLRAMQVTQLPISFLEKVLRTFEQVTKSMTIKVDWIHVKLLLKILIWLLPHWKKKGDLLSWTLKLKKATYLYFFDLIRRQIRMSHFQSNLTAFHISSCKQAMCGCDYRVEKKIV